MELKKSINEVRQYGFYENYLLVNKADDKDVVVIKNGNFDNKIALGINTSWFQLYRSYMFCQGMRVVDLNKLTVIDHEFSDCFFEKGYKGDAIISFYDRQKDISSLRLLHLESWEWNSIENIKGGVVAAKDDFLICTEGEHLHCYKNFVLAWEKDLTAMGAYTDIFGKARGGDIHRIEVHDDKLIVIKGIVIVAYELSSGELAWELKSPKWPFGLYLLIDGDIGYCTDSIGYQVIDLNKGAFMSDIISLKKIALKNETIAPTGVRMVFHDGLLWHAISNNGINVIASIVPSTGEYNSYEQIDAKGWLHTPSFYHDDMYILTSEAALLIFSK